MIFFLANIVSAFALLVYYTTTLATAKATNCRLYAVQMVHSTPTGELSTQELAEFRESKYGTSDQLIMSIVLQYVISSREIGRKSTQRMVTIYQ